MMLFGIKRITLMNCGINTIVLVVITEIQRLAQCKRP